MPIPLEDAGTPGLPVLKRRSIGEQFVGGLVRLEQRQTIRDGQPQFKPDGKPRQELVVTLMALESTMVAGIGENLTVPARGELVRLILKGGGFGQWIEVRNAFVSANRPVQVGDLVRTNTTHATRYASMGNHQALGDITTQAELESYYASNEAYRARSESLGFRGELAIVAAPPEQAAMVAMCEEHYQRLVTQAIPAEEASPAEMPPANRQVQPMPTPTPMASPDPQPAPAAPSDGGQGSSLADLFG